MSEYARPLRNSVVETLEARGALSTEDLFKRLREEYDVLTLQALEKELMKLEIEGVVSVTALGRGRKRVELLRGRAPSARGAQ